MDVSIIIVNYNTKDLTLQCINSIYEKTQGISYEVILVDNASVDGSKEYFQSDNRIIYIYSEENLGFGRANNLGCTKTSGKYLFLLNSDTILLENSIKIFFDYMEKNDEISACGGNIVNYDHKNISIGGNFPTLFNDFLQIGFYKIIRNYYSIYYSISQTISDLKDNSIDYIVGADIFIRKEIFEELGGFDPSFFMYYEETDLFKRMFDKGLKSVILRETSIVHLVGSSSSSLINSNKYRMIHQSKMKYYRKHYSIIYVFSAKVLNFIAVILRPHTYKKEYFKILIETLKA